MTFLCVIALRSKTIAHTFLPSFDNANGRFCQERLLRSRNFATMVTWRHTSPLYYVFTKYSAPMISWSVSRGSENIEVLWHTLCSNVITKKIIRLTGVFVLWFRCSEVPLYRLSSVPLAFSINNIHYIFAIIIAVTTIFLNIIIIIIIITSPFTSTKEIFFYNKTAGRFSIHLTYNRHINVSAQWPVFRE